MLENRLQADAAAARGFPGEAPAAAAQTSEAEIQEQAREFAELMEAQPEKQAPEAVPAAPVQQAHQLEQNGLVRISQPSEPASQVSKSPFPNVPAGMAAVEPEEKQLAKIEKARAYMAVGAKAQAQELLEDVVKTSTGRVQQTASGLMAMLEKK